MPPTKTLCCTENALNPLISFQPALAALSTSCSFPYACKEVQTPPYISRTLHLGVGSLHIICSTTGLLPSHVKHNTRRTKVLETAMHAGMCWSNVLHPQPMRCPCSQSRSTPINTQLSPRSRTVTEPWAICTDTHIAYTVSQCMKGRCSINVRSTTRSKHSWPWNSVYIASLQTALYRDCKSRWWSTLTVWHPHLSISNV